MTHGADPEFDAILLYDGVCGLCQRTVRFIVKRDTRNRIRFAPLQSRVARDLLVKHGKDPSSLDTLYLLTGVGTPHETVLAKSRAVLGFCSILGGPWRLTRALSIVPAPILDFFYDRIASIRYRIFGKLDACPVPTEAERAKLIGWD